MAAAAETNRAAAIAAAAEANRASQAAMEQVMMELMGMVDPRARDYLMQIERR